MIIFNLQLTLARYHTMPLAHSHESFCRILRKSVNLVSEIKLSTKRKNPTNRLVVGFRGSPTERPKEQLFVLGERLCFATPKEKK